MFNNYYKNTHYGYNSFSKAYAAGVRYPQYMLIHPAWYAANWWNGSYDNVGCSAEQRETVIPHTLSVYQYEFIEDYDRKADTGTVCA